MRSHKIQKHNICPTRKIKHRNNARITDFTNTNSYLTVQLLFLAGTLKFPKSTTVHRD
jgi:hypothetical protein